MSHSLAPHVRHGISALERKTGKSLRALRKRKGLSQKNLALLLGTNINHIKKYEKGKNHLPLALFILMVEILEGDFHALLDQIRKD